MFQRTRPSDTLDSFSFPSGHTSSAAFTLGALFHILLPAYEVLVAAPQQQQQQRSAEGADAAVISQAGQPLTDTVASKDPLIGLAIPACLEQAEQATSADSVAAVPFQVPGWVRAVQGSWGLWGVGCATTASGRVLADAHWLTDTAAAMCLGLCVISTLAACARPIMRKALTPMPRAATNVNTGSSREPL
jgi:membrane-associated phospholipid phosphatase